MHATIRRYDGVDQNRTVELTGKVNESLVPKLSKLDGFRGYYLIEAGNGVMSLLGLFETPAQAEESTKVASSWVATRSSRPRSARPRSRAARSWAQERDRRRVKSPLERTWGGAHRGSSCDATRATPRLRAGSRSGWARSPRPGPRRTSPAAPA